MRLGLSREPLRRAAQQAGSAWLMRASVRVQWSGVHEPQWCQKLFEARARALVPPICAQRTLRWVDTAAASGARECGVGGT